MAENQETIPVNPCLNCPGLCCKHNLINLCTYDIWLIVRNLHISPTDFVGFASLGRESPYDFVIDGSGKAYCMVINMKERPDGSRRCMFALDLPEPAVRCGIYDIRPIACRAYPFAFACGKAAVKSWAFCPKPGWDSLQPDQTFWVPELARHDMEFSIHAFLVHVWNTEMIGKPVAEKLNFRPFFEYVFTIYYRLEESRSQIPNDAWPQIWLKWREYTARGQNPLLVKIEESEVTGWATWQETIREAVITAKSHVDKLFESTN